MTKACSRISGFHRLSPTARRQALYDTQTLSKAAEDFLESDTQLPFSVLDRMTENVVNAFSLPFSVALNFRVNDEDTVIPMAVEEPSIVAAASNAARMVRASGGFYGEADPPVMTAQIQLNAVPEVTEVAARLDAAKARLLALGNAAIPRMVARGGGCEDMDVRILSEAEGLVVVHVYVNVGDAMGANLVDTVAEELAPSVQSCLGGEIGLRILSNLPLRRMVTVHADVDFEALGGEAMADGIAKASRFAELDIFRAVTHNKGVLNAIDAAAVALGQDWRAIEAGAHAYAGMEAGYKALALWERTDTGLRGHLTMPLAVAAVGGSTTSHAAVTTAFELVGTRDARRLAVILASSGLACNLAALRALAGEGIQEGHMRLHMRKNEAAQ